MNEEEKALAEKLTGVGRVFKGQEFITDVRYELQIHSHYNTTRTMGGEGRYLTGETVQLNIIPPTAVSGLLGVDRLTLHMTDGRRLNFFVTTSEGRCEATGGPY